MLTIFTPWPHNENIFVHFLSRFLYFRGEKCQICFRKLLQQKRDKCSKCVRIIIIIDSGWRACGSCLYLIFVCVWQRSQWRFWKGSWVFGGLWGDVPVARILLVTSFSGHLRCCRWSTPQMGPPFVSSGSQKEAHYFLSVKWLRPFADKTYSVSGTKF